MSILYTRARGARSNYSAISMYHVCLYKSWWNTYYSADNPATLTQEMGRRISSIPSARRVAVRRDEPPRGLLTLVTGTG